MYTFSPRSNVFISICILVLGLLQALPAPASANPAAPGARDEAPEVRVIYANDGSSIVDVVPKLVESTVAGERVTMEALEYLGLAGGDARAATPDLAPGDVPGDRGFDWDLQCELSGVIKDLSMSDATNGFIVAELGKVYRTVDGSTWTLVLNLGFPYYWYGVHAFDSNTAIIIGFINNTGEGIVRWTGDGGATWTDDIIIDPDDWLLAGQFADSEHGIVLESSGVTFYTDNGGSGASDWHEVQADPSGGWFGKGFSFLPDLLYVYVAGISFCRSRDGGQSYFCRPSIDDIFDGAVTFSDTMHGWTGGGTISPNCRGWVHRTTDGCQTWSDRILETNYPIRKLLFFNENLGFAVGGDYMQGVGGIWSTTDGGDNWNRDMNSYSEMIGIDWARVDSDSVDVWCAGSKSNQLGKVYKTRIHLPEDPTGVQESSPAAAPELTAYPNPFNPRVTLGFETPAGGRHAQLSIVDAAGRSVIRLSEDFFAAGENRVVWDGRDEAGRTVASGVYLAVLRQEGERAAYRLLVLVR